MIIDLQDPQSLTNAQRNGQANHVQKEPQEFMNLLYSSATSHAQSQAFRSHNQAGQGRKDDFEYRISGGHKSW
jgi:hypothetical protein